MCLSIAGVPFGPLQESFKRIYHIIYSTLVRYTTVDLPANVCGCPVMSVAICTTWDFIKDIIVYKVNYIIYDSKFLLPDIVTTED